MHGKEIEPNFGQMGLVRTGYLHSSYSEHLACACTHTHTHTHTHIILHSPTESEARGTADILDFQEVNRRLHIDSYTKHMYVFFPIGRKLNVVQEDEPDIN